MIAEYAATQAKYAELFSKAKRLRDAIALIAETMGLEYELPPPPDSAPGEAPERQAVGLAAEPEIKNGQFFGRPHLDAAEEYLRTTRQSPKSVEDILGALKRGGAVFNGKDPRGSLYVQLVRSTKRFVKLPSGEFGLLDWYPTEHAKRVSRRRTERKPHDESSSASQSSDTVASGSSGAGHEGGAAA